MSLPSDLNADVAEAVDATETAEPARARRAGRSLFRTLTPEQYGFAAAMLVAFLGVAICGPRVYTMRHPRRRPLPERARRGAEDLAREARRSAEDARDQATRKLRRLGERYVRR